MNDIKKTIDDEILEEIDEILESNIGEIFVKFVSEYSKNNKEDVL